MADYSMEEVESHTKKYIVRLTCYPCSYGSELSKAFSAIYSKYKEVFGHEPKFDDAIKVITSHDDIIMFFETEL
jgi:hypothetical protein